MVSGTEEGLEDVAREGRIERERRGWKEGDRSKKEGWREKR